MTPPGSSRSIAIGKGLTQLSAGALDNLQVVVSDVHEARAELAGRGVDVSEVDVRPWGSFVSFGDADGNRWLCSRCPTMRRLRLRAASDRCSRSRLSSFAGPGRSEAAQQPGRAVR